jgi:hypothetical protein
MGWYALFTDPDDNTLGLYQKGWVVINKSVQILLTRVIRVLLSFNKQ